MSGWKGERISHATIQRLLDCGEMPEMRGAGAFDGIQIMDLVLDLQRARAQRDRFQARANHLRVMIAKTVTAARAVLYELAGRELRSERIVTKRMRNLTGKGRGNGPRKRRLKVLGIVPAHLDPGYLLDGETPRISGPLEDA